MLRRSTSTMLTRCCTGMSSGMAKSEVKVPACDFHSQQMVIADDPVAYLKKHAH